MIPISDYFWNTAKHPPKPVCVVFGDDEFLKTNGWQTLRSVVLADDDAQFSFSEFDGNTVKDRFVDVLKDLQTQTMFGSSKRFVLVDDADTFVTKNRDRLEQYVQKPADGAVLTLILKAFASNTKLYKEVDKTGLIIEAKTLPEKEMLKWIVQWAKHQYKTVCEPNAAELMLQRIGAEHGLLDQELAKLSGISKGETISVELVRENTGAWRALTVFQMLDFALDGNTAEAVRQLDNLLLAGEQPIRILGAISASLRKFASATRLILDAEKQGRKLSVDSVLQTAGVQHFFVQKAKTQMLKLGRYRGLKLQEQLLQLDLDLKGDSRCEPRLLLERFVIWLSNMQLRPTG
ncbi:MAG: DNA polymerase III subunit delta [Planctomycetaceae bacterium]|nr:DNA polymerase III subunit delta [Planctomycetaceae bacterium]